MLRPFLDLGILFSQHFYLTFASGLLLWLVLATGWRARGHRRHILLRLGPGLIRGLVLCLLVLFLAIGLWYLQLDGFAGEVEPLISSVSWLVQEGAPLYHDLDSPERYSVLYGPSVFLTNGLFLQLLGPSLFSAKIASFLAGIGSLLLLFATLARRKPATVAWGMTGLAVLYYWSQGFAVYLVRPDALLLFAVSLALFCAVRVRVGLALVAVGVLLGFGLNLKCHAILYFLPVFAVLGQRVRKIQLGQAFGIGLLVTLLPFALHPQVSLPNYLGWLQNAMGHGLEVGSTTSTARFAIFLILPLVTVLMLHNQPRTWLRQARWTIGSMLVGLGLTFIIAAKPGAGIVHFLPFVPLTLYLTGLVAFEVETPRYTDSFFAEGRARLSGAVVPAMVMAVLMAGGVHAYRAVKLINWQVNQVPGLAQDVQQIMDTYPDMEIAMACGGEASKFRATWVRPLLVYRDNPLFIDPIAVMDCRLAGRAMPELTYRAMASGKVGVWLVPRGARPFDKVNWYPPHEKIFDERFQAEFESHYTARAQSRYFDLWFWNGLPAEMGDYPVFAGLDVGL